MLEAEANWFELRNAEPCLSPALLVYRDRVAANLRRMMAIARDVDRLRPHVKTHKMADVVQLQLSLGITKFKCATIAEAEMLGLSQAPDVMLAYPLIGLQTRRAAGLATRFPSCRFSFVADSESALRQLASEFASSGLVADVLLDLNVGMDRTGIDPQDPGAAHLYRLMDELPGVRPAGLHVYDGHIAESDCRQRATMCDDAFERAQRLRRDLLRLGLEVPRVVAGGTPTFPIHARRDGVECSPGTCIFWDFGYADKFPDLQFDFAALLLTRVVSRPSSHRLCLDLGYKAVAADQPQPRVRLLNCPDAKCVAHNEEHLVIDTPNADQYPVGTLMYAVPKHICPSVALYREAAVVEDGQIVTTWPVSARDRRLSI